jgi:hypothetical protein
MKMDSYKRWLGVQTLKDSDSYCQELCASLVGVAMGVYTQYWNGYWIRWRNGFQFM